MKTTRLWLFLFFGALSSIQGASPSPLSEIEESHRAKLDALQQTTAEWIRVQRTLKDEEDRGQRQLTNLAQLKEVVTTQRDRWQKEALALENRASKADEERKNILKEQADLENSRSKAITQLKALESKLKGLQGMAPQPLQEELAIPLLKLQQPFRDESWLTRYQAAMEILHTTQSFNRRFSIFQHDVAIDGAKPQAGTILYMGLSNAYFLSVNKKKAAWGRPSTKGWVWNHADEHLEAITEAISMAEGKTIELKLAQLPVEVQP